MKRLLTLVAVPVALVALAAPANARPDPNPAAVENADRACEAVLTALAGGAQASLGRAEKGAINFYLVGEAFGCHD